MAPVVQNYGGVGPSGIPPLHKLFVKHASDKGRNVSMHGEKSPCGFRMCKRIELKN